MTTATAERPLSPEQSARATELDIARLNYDAYTRALGAGHREFIARATTCENFYVGNQWKSDVKKMLEDESRPAMTVNLITAAVNAVVGDFIHQAADFSFKPRRGAASQEVAATLTKVVMQVCSNNGYEFAEKLLVEDGLITSRGYLDVYLDYTDNVLGEVRIDALDPRSVIPDPSAADYDPAKWNEYYTIKQLSPDAIELQFGKDKADRLRTSCYVTEGFDEAFEWTDKPTFGDIQRAHHLGLDIEGNRYLSSVWVVTRHYFKLAKVREVVDPVNGDIRELPQGWSDEKVAMYVQAKRLILRERAARKIRTTITAGSVVLFDDWSGERTFSLVPFFCYFRRGKSFSIVDNLLNPQEMLNKIESQILHIVNTTANSGWKVPTGSLTNMTADELAKNGAKTGLVLEYNSALGEPEKIQPNQIPSGLTNISQTLRGSIQSISGINAGMLGLLSSDASGDLADNLKDSGSVQLSTIKTNLRQTRQILARRLVELIQSNYTEERLLFITGVDGETEELVINQQTAAGTIANDLTMGEYEVVVGTMPARDNFEESQFAQTMSMREAGVMVPDHRVIQYSNLHRKHELAQEVAQLTGFGEPDEMSLMMQQLQVQMLQGQVQEVFANIETLLAQAELTRAKAGAEADAPQLERERIAHEAQTTETEQSVRLQVQRLKELSSQLQSMVQVQAKANEMRENRKLELQKHVETTKAQAKNAQSSPRSK